MFYSIHKQIFIYWCCLWWSCIFYDCSFVCHCLHSCVLLLTSVYKQCKLDPISFLIVLSCEMLYPRFDFSVLSFLLTGFIQYRLLTGKAILSVKYRYRVTSYVMNTLVCEYCVMHVISVKQHQHNTPFALVQLLFCTVYNAPKQLLISDACYLESCKMSLLLLHICCASFIYCSASAHLVCAETCSYCIQ